MGGVLNPQGKKTADLIQITLSGPEICREIFWPYRQSCRGDPMAVLQLRSEEIIRPYDLYYASLPDFQLTFPSSSLLYSSSIKFVYSTTSDLLICIVNDVFLIVFIYLASF